MTLCEALDRIDALKPNAFSKAEKVAWISQLEGRVKEEILDAHEGPERVFHGYTDMTDGSTPLLVDGPFAELYVYYVSAMIDYYNRETVAYNNGMDLFNALYAEYFAFYNRRHMPKRGRFRFFTPAKEEVKRGGPSLPFPLKDEG